MSGNDVSVLQHGAVITFQVGLLCGNLAAVLLKLVFYPLCAAVVCLAVHGARSEGALCLGKGVGAVGVEVGAYEGHGVGIVGRLLRVLA